MALSLLFCATISAQQQSRGPTDNGITAAFGSYPISGIDTVNLYNGHASLKLPLAKIGARGNAGYSPEISISRTFVLRTYQNWSYAGNPVQWGTPFYKLISERYNDSYDYSNFQPGLLPAVIIGRRTRDHNPDPGFTIPPSPSACYTLTKLYLRFAGSEIELRDEATSGQPNYDQSSGNSPQHRGLRWYSVDGSAMLFVSDSDIVDETCVDNGIAPMNGINVFFPTGYLMLKDGTRYRFVDGYPVWMRDRNGNTLTFSGSSSAKDSIGRQYQLTGGVSYKDHNGNSQTVTVVTGNLDSALRSDLVAAGVQVRSLQTLFPGVNFENSSAIFDPPVTTAVQLPNGLAYHFFYNEYGELARIEMPTGGAIEYDYAPGSGTNGTSVYPSSTPQVYRVAIARRTYDVPGHQESRQTFDYSFNGGVLAPTVKTYDSSNAVVSNERHTFIGTVGDDFNFIGWYQAFNNGRESKVESLDATGNVMRQVDNTWQTLDPTGAPTQPPPVGSTHATILDCALTLVKTTLTDTNQVTQTSFAYDAKANQIDTYDYDFGSGSAGALLRRTHVDFNNASAYIQYPGPYVLDLPVRRWVSSDAAGLNKLALTEFEYDNYTTDSKHALLVGRTNIAGLCLDLDTTAANCLQASDPSYSPRGNLTQATVYFDIAHSGAITTASQYDVAGNAVKTIDGRGNALAIEYADCFGTPDGLARCSGAPYNANLPPAELAGQFSFAFPTATTNALGHITYAQYDYYRGLMVDTEDPNGIVTSTYYNDVFDRQTQIVYAANRPEQTQTTTSYDDTNRTITSESDQISFNDKTLKGMSVYDGLGRTIETRHYEGGSNYIAVQTQYDAMGRSYKVSNPFRPGETVVWTQTAFDSLGRVHTINTPDGSMVTTDYSSNFVLVTDQIGTQRLSKTNAIGQLKDVWEVKASDSETEAISFPAHAEVTAGYHTAYGYDVLDDLVSVMQSTQHRYFMYDSLKRLVRAKNPEQDSNSALSLSDAVTGNSQWSLAYDYDNNGNLWHRTDARNITTTYAYDSLNRIMSRTYNDNPQTPTVSYFYDSQTLPAGAPTFDRGYSTGRLVAMTYGSGSSEGSYQGYDALGRPLRLIQRTGTTNYEVDTVYNLGGAISAETYPSGRTVAYAYDQAGRANSFTGYLGDGVNRTYSTGILYSPLGGMSKEQFGTDTPIYNKLFYNSRGQLSEIRESTSYTGPTDTSWNRGAIINHYSDQCWGACNGTDNNGNIKKQEHWIPDNEAVSSYVVYTSWFNYDALNRLQYTNGERYASAGNQVNNQWKQTFVYDRYGNRTIDTNVNNTFGAGINNKGFTVAASTNRLGVPSGQSGAMGYDYAGNLINDTYTGAPNPGGNNRIYDAENRMTQAWGGNNQWQYYTYNGDGQRVRRKVDGTETWQVYGIGGELVAEYPASSPASAPSKEYGYRNGQLLVTAEGSAGAVTWTSAVGVSVSANNLSKPGSNGWNAGAVSTQTISSGDGYVEFTATETNTHRRLGLSLGDSNQSWDDIDFCIYLQNNGTVDINEGATSRGSFGSYAAGDVFRVAVEGGVVKYRKNGTLLYTSTVTPTYPLLVDTSLYSTNATLTNVRLVVGGNVAWTSAVGVTVSGNSLSKPGANGWDAGAVSTRTIASGDGYVQFTATETNTHRRLGLSYGNTNQSWDDIDFCIYLENNGTVDINEGATTRGSFGSYAAGDVFRVAVENGVVKYRKNGALLYTSTVTPTYPLLVDTSLYSTNATLTNVVMYVGASAANVQWLVTDQLGTPRMVFDKTGSLAAMKRHDYLPFGEEISAYGGRTTTQGYNVSDGIRQQFTQKERDNETGLDFFEARYYSSTQGRFTSADDFLNDTHPTDPAGWNLYAYVRNNPLRYVDPTGEKIYVGDITNTADRDEVLRRANYTYGCKDCVTVGKDGFLAVNTTGLSKDVLKATAYLTDAITSNDPAKLFSVQVTNNNSQVAFGDSQAGSAGVKLPGNNFKTSAIRIRLDFGDDKWVSGDKGAKEAFLNLVFAHEVAHFVPNYVHDPDDGRNTGPVVDAVNEIQQARGLLLRAQYGAFGRGSSGDFVSVEFGQAKTNRAGNIVRNKAGGIEVNRTNKTVTWVKRTVGGTGIN